jgi:hypothetical protein
MKKILNFENFVKEGHKSFKDLSREEIIKELVDMQEVYDMDDLESMNDDQLESLYHDVLFAKNDEPESGEPTTELEYESKKWIQDAIKRPGSLRRRMRKKAGEKISKGEIDSELQALMSRDKDREKPGLQLSKRDSRKHKQLVLARTLKGLK